MGRTVVVFGSINVDLSVHVDRLPAGGETVVGGSLLRAWGGKGANQAVAAARYGASVRMVGAVGRDEWAEPALRALAAEGVSIDSVARVDDSTGTALIVVDRDGDNLIAVAPGANHHVNETMLTDLLDEPPGVLVACFEVPVPIVFAGVRAALDRGWTVVLNPAPATRLGPEWRDMPLVLTPNQSEALVIGESAATAGDIAAKSQWTVVVTLGSLGAQVATRTASFRVPAPAVQAVDATGAGDTFNGVLAALLAEGAGLEMAVREAVAAASYSTENRGARTGMPTRAELAARHGAVEGRS